MSDDVMIAVDPHKASNTAAVLDPVTKTVIDAVPFIVRRSASAAMSKADRDRLADEVMKETMRLRKPSVCYTSRSCRG